MPFATGVAKKLLVKKEPALSWGVLPANTAAQAMRRVTSSLDLTKDVYSSNEIRDDYQEADYRHGTRKVAGAISGELSPKTYSDFMAAALRAPFTAVSAVTNTTAAAVAAGGIINGFNPMSTNLKVGQVVRITGMTSSGNNNRNWLITSMNSTQMTGVFLDGGAALANSSAGPSTTFTVVGKVCAAPLTGHTDDSFSIEHWHSDIAQSEVYIGCKVSKQSVKLPATGIATIDTEFMGKDIVPGVANYFSNSTVAATTTGVVAAVNGAVVVGGSAIGYITGLEFTIDGGHSVESVVGSNTTPDVFEGVIAVSGQFTALFQDATFRDLFVSETEVGIVAAFTTANNGTADFLSFSMPRVKAGGNSKSDGPKGIVQTVPFKALLNINGGATADSLKTVMQIQDSAA